LLAHALGVPRVWLLAHSDDIFDDADKRHAANSLLTKRIHRVPLAYLTGVKEFYGRTFAVSPDVLIPRPETEEVIDLVRSLSLPEDSHAVDVGTGSGAIGLTLKAEIPTIGDIALIDISPEALQIAKLNNDHIFHHTRVHYHISDLLSFFNPDATIDPYIGLVVANLPYVDVKWERSPETEFEPSLALFADDNGLALIKRLITEASRILVQAGYLVLEADPEQHEAIKKTGAAHGLRFVDVLGYAIALRKD
jgi:release factor glutamine methyltransferase